MTTALYRRYRPETFAEMIGQAQVTEPLMTALRSDRVGHAYLFSGPRGCGKTTSARILARCLNCAQGPTDTPCGVCESCVELGRGGGGSLDVVEIDAASHNGVDDARDLRERAVFAPARDRFKIFILDEAHMVTPQGFNALLKLVEEPPDHVKFIFATTEPEKVIGTIRSRTHHYPFRLVAPAAMLEYVEQLCAQEGVTIEPGVLPLVVRAGGGSPRDTLSVLDQLIAGSEDSAVGYARAVALLGYTPADLLDEVVDAFGAQDAGAAFTAVDRVVQTGQDPRRFLDDLLERLRDLIIVAATGDAAAAVLRGVPADELARMSSQAGAFGAERLSRVADIVVAALDEMTGATSPRLQLELMIARVLTHGGAVAGAGGVAATPAPAAAAPAAAADSPAPADTPAAGGAAPAAGGTGLPVSASEPAAQILRQPPVQTVDAAAYDDEPPGDMDEPPECEPRSERARMDDSWPTILERLEGVNRASWLVATAATVVDFADDVLTLSFDSASDVAKFKKLQAGAGPSEDLRQAIHGVLGIRVKYLARHVVAGTGHGPADGRDQSSANPTAAPGRGRQAPADAPRPHSGGPAAPAGSAPAEPSAPAGSFAATGSAPAGSPGAAGSARADEPSASAPRSTPGASAPVSPPRSTPAGSARPAPPRSAPASAAPVTEWAVATIPTGGDDALALPVDDDPEDVASPLIATLAPPHEGDVLAAGDIEAPGESDDDDPTDAAVSAAPPRAAPRPPQASTRDDGVQRVGEAVVRQILGATFVREEPYESPTRFQ
ncbi:hypothetical protein GCM10022240_11630 [Microbacterium kribbense]|uniref:DNA polymerase III subunit gamma/tau n=1 Tax=Microbacterium kribbense TaxID=433645 RepID=A0ABP7GBH2_9MICO